MDRPLASDDVSTQFTGMSEPEARDFASRWLPAWTGNDPVRLVSFYSDDAYYSDPVVSSGIRGRAALGVYFTRLLKRNPAWTWTQTRSAPMRDGFVNYWRAQIPVPGGGGGEVVQVDGVCLVSIREGLIFRNEVFFDRSLILPRSNGEG